uniref:Putative retrotransposon protein n=1 Tax=Oryza sativa subsp. indica TaxID=39946 RepID=C5NNQ8_ORYSI|nr:putative retrotransposon protein [Oryza sativa Indica Group]
MKPRSVLKPFHCRNCIVSKREPGSSTTANLCQPTAFQIERNSTPIPIFFSSSACSRLVFPDHRQGRGRCRSGVIAELRRLPSRHQLMNER